MATTVDLFVIIEFRNHHKYYHDLETRMKKIYITGLAGMLGSNLAFLLKEKYKVAGVDRIPVTMHGIEASCFDMLEEERLYEDLARVKPELVIHTAAAVNVDRCEQEPEFAKKLNETLTYSLANCCKMLGISLIYISTDAVFEGSIPGLYTEEDQPKPVNEYGKTKLAGEKYVLELENGLVLRTNIYGFNVQSKYSFGEWVVSCLLEGQTLSMFDDIYFSPILVNDLAQVIDLCINQEVCGLYHACGTGSVNKYEFGCYMKEVFHIQTGQIVRAQSSQHEFIAKRSKNMGMSNQRLSKLLGIRMRTPQESIELFYELYQQGYQNKLTQFGGVNV